MVGGTLHRLDEEIPMTPKSPVPPFTRESALQKVQAAEDAWNTCDPVTVSRAYTLDTVWRNRSEHLHGREEVVARSEERRVGKGCGAGSSEDHCTKDLSNYRHDRIKLHRE